MGTQNQKNGRECPRKANGPRMPRGNKWDTKARKQCNKKPNDHTESLKEE